jgi:hypothetical protein
MLMAIHTSVLNSNGYTKIMVPYGEASSGKTTFSCELFGKENTLLFDCENGSKFQEGINVWSPTEDPMDRPFKWEHFEQAASDVVRKKYTTFVVDNFFNLCMWLEKSIIDKANEDLKSGQPAKKTLSDFGFGKGEKACKAELFRFFNYFVQNNIGLVIICHKKKGYKTIKSKTGEAEQLTTNELNLPGYAMETVVPISDYIFYFYKNSFGEFRIKVKSDGDQVCKDRTGTLPDDLPNNPVLMRKLLLSSEDIMNKRIRDAKDNLRASWEDEAQNYLKELGLE